MTIELRHPLPGEESQLRALFTEGFGDEGFTELFFRTGYGPERCLAAFDGELLAALHWFDCSLDGKKAAYIYGIAAFKRCRGLGIGSRLIRGALVALQALGYTSAEAARAINLVRDQADTVDQLILAAIRQMSTL